MKHRISQAFSNKITTYRLVEVQNSETRVNSALDFLWPLKANQLQEVIDYKNKIAKQVDEHNQQYNHTAPEEFFRPQNKPQNESFFTSTANRQRFENILLKKGIEILDEANPNKKNIRALGYSLPSQKDFGFGTLCFTWHNIPNNTPLVFWYSGGGFYTLFEKKSRSAIFTFFSNKVKIPNPNKPKDNIDDLPF